MLLDGTAVPLIPFAAALLHELGHIAVMRMVGAQVREVEITLFGADIEMADNGIGGLRRFAVYSAGAAANLLSFTVALCLLDGELWDFFAACSVCLAGFNLLPIETLDGGRMAEVVCRRMFPRHCGAVMRAVSTVTLCILWLVAVYLLLVFGGNISLLLFCMYMFASLYLRR